MHMLLTKKARRTPHRTEHKSRHAKTCFNPVEGVGPGLTVRVRFAVFLARVISRALRAGLLVGDDGGGGDEHRVLGQGRIDQI